MHRTAFARTQGRTRRTRSRRLWPRSLKNRLARHWTSGHGPRSWSAGLGRGRGGARRRSFVHGTRPSLRHNHPRRWSLWWSSGRRRRSRTRRCGRSRGYRRSGNRRRGRCRRHDCRRRRCCWTSGRTRCRSCRRDGRLLCRRRRYYRTCWCGWCWLCRHWSCGRGCRRRWLGHRRHNGRLGRNWWRGGLDRRGGRFLFLRDRAQHIARARDVR
jgi:hypothetical protein